MKARTRIDAAPLAGGAGVNGQKFALKSTRLALVPPAHHKAPAEGGAA